MARVVGVEAVVCMLVPIILVTMSFLKKVSASLAPSTMHRPTANKYEYMLTTINN